MSNWIKVTNLPYYYDEKEAHEMFGEIGPIKRVEVEHVELLLKSNALIQFVNARNARLAATKKDQMMFGDDTIRVRVVWCNKETLTTVKVSNLPSGTTDRELRDYFSPYGDIVDVRFVKNPSSTEASDKQEEPMTNELVACISFARVDYALRACHEMHHSIISGSSNDSGLCVSLVNPDSRNLKWKRNLFEYVRCPVPSKRTKHLNNRQSKNSNSNSSKTMKANGIQISLPKGYSPPSVCNTNATMNTTAPGVYTQWLNMSSKLPNTSINIAGSMMNWLPSMGGSNRGVNSNTEPLSASELVSGASETKSSVGTVPYSVTFHDINSFNNVNGNYINVADIIPKLNIADLLLQPNTQLQSPRIFTHDTSTPTPLSSSVKSENTPSNFRFPSTGGMSSPFAPLLMPNMIMNLPQNGGFVSPVSTCSSSATTPLLSHGFPTPRLVNNSSNSSSVMSLQQTQTQKMGSPNTNANNLLSPTSIQSSMPSFGNLNFVVTNPIQTLPTMSVNTGQTSTSTYVNGTVISNRLLNSPSLASLTTFSDTDKELMITTDPNITSPQKTMPAGSVCSTNSDAQLSPSIWSAKQREIGDMLYHELKVEFPYRVAKLTGMLLSLPKDELNLLLIDKCKLKTRVHQFIQLLDKNESSV